MSEWEILGRMALAGVLGLGVGLDRELKQKPAGLRTHALVAVGAAAFMGASLLISQALVDSGSGVTIDQSRIAAGVVTGVGFLGAGAIIQTRSGVHGLTTAAGIWVTAGIGVLAGAGFYITAVGAAAVGIVAHVVVLRAAKLIEVRATTEPLADTDDPSGNSPSDST